MRPVLEERQRNVAARQLVVAPAAIILLVARSASRPVKRRVLPVQIVFPSRRVRHRLHHLVASRALPAALCVRGHRVMAGKAFGAGFRRRRLVLGAKRLGMKCRLHAAGMVGGQRTFPCVQVAGAAVRHACLRRHPSRLIMARHAIHHAGQRTVRRVAGGAFHFPRGPQPEMRRMRENDSGILRRQGRRFQTLRRIARLVVAGIAVALRRHGRQDTRPVKAVAEHAVRPKSRSRIDARLGVEMLQMREGGLPHGLPDGRHRCQANRDRATPQKRHATPVRSARELAMSGLNTKKSLSRL